jgi:hypothetical protein
MTTTGVGGCGGGCGGKCAGGCGSAAIALVPARQVLNRLSPTPAQAAEIMQRRGTYRDWVTDVPVQGPTDEGIRRAGCWWKNNVLDKVTDRQGAMVPRWTQSSALCVGGRPVAAGVGGVGEVVRRGNVRIGALGQGSSAPPPAPAAATAPPAAAVNLPPPPGIWATLSEAESHWIAATLIKLNDLILKAGSKPCTSWPADLLQDDASAVAKMPTAVACFQGWFNLNVKPTRMPMLALRTDGTLDHATLCAIVAVAKDHASDFPTPYPGTVFCLSTLPLYAKVGLGVGAIAAVGGTLALLTRKKRTSSPAPAGG